MNNKETYSDLKSDVDKIDFGFKKINKNDKIKQVANVFNSVAYRYDIMNDIMSFGLHRLWKKFLINHVFLRPGMKILDIAAGTGDLTKYLINKVGFSGEVWLTDINQSMLNIGIDRLLDDGFILPAIVCDAENLPFSSCYFDRIIVAFGLRNMTNKDVALSEMYRVLKPGGRLLILEFSKINSRFFSKIYDIYSFNVIPWFGKKIVNDKASYEYLIESIRVHPNQDVVASMMENVGFSIVKYINLSAGVVALHEGIKI